MFEMFGVATMRRYYEFKEQWLKCSGEQNTQIYKSPHWLLLTINILFLAGQKSTNFDCIAKNTNERRDVSH